MRRSACSEEKREKKKEQLEKERLKLERQKNIDKYGCSFENTELIEDEFSEKSIITTKRFGTFKQSGLFQEVKYVNQSSQLDYHHMAMPSVNIDTTRGMWASVKLEQSKTLKKYFIIGSQCRGFQFMLILDLWGISFHPVVVVGLGNDLLFNFIVGHCDVTNCRLLNPTLL